VTAAGDSQGRLASATIGEDEIQRFRSSQWHQFDTLGDGSKFSPRNETTPSLADSCPSPHVLSLCFGEGFSNFAPNDPEFVHPSLCFSLCERSPLAVA